MAATNPLSFLHVVKPEIDLEPGIDLYSDPVYAKGAENLQRLKDDGVLIREERPALYLYRQRMGDHVQTGLVTGASIDEYEADLIKKHEHTRPKKEDDRTRHVEALNSNTGPVFLTYRARPEIDALVERLTAADPTYDFIAPDGIQHVLWVVADPADVDALVAAFADVPELYVADGHHRSAAATRVRALRKDRNPDHTGEEAYNYFLSVIFPHDQMLIMDYNRVVKDTVGLDRDTFLAKVKEVFESGPLCGAETDLSPDLRDVLRGSVVSPSGQERELSRRRPGCRVSMSPFCRTICSRRSSASAIRGAMRISISSAGSEDSKDSKRE